MTSWAVVCDVYFLEPQTKGPDETSQHFAERVQKLIAQRASLHIAPWDGYLKYYNLGDKVSCSARHCVSARKVSLSICSHIWHLSANLAEKVTEMHVHTPTNKGSAATHVLFVSGSFWLSVHSACLHMTHPRIDNALHLLQHPDLIEKRRKAFADVIKQHLKAESSPMSDGIDHEDQ